MTTDIMTDKQIAIALRRMHKIVGVPFNIKNCRQGGWYLNYSWSSIDEAKFNEWLLKKLKRWYPNHTASNLKWEAGVFIFLYGWRVTDSVYDYLKRGGRYNKTFW